MKKILYTYFAFFCAICSFAEDKINIDDITKNADAGNPDAQLQLGSFYAKGENGLKADGQKAILYLSKAAEQNLPAAQAYLGYIYGEGKVVPRNFELAILWREKAASQGSTADKWSLGNAFLYGFFLPKDQIKALFWITQAAEDNHPDAISKLIEIYTNLKNQEQIEIWEKRFALLEIEAAKNGNVDAMASIAKKFMTGKGGLPKNRPNAIYWYKTAADKGNVEAMETIAQMYAKGRFLPKNQEKAEVYFAKLSEKNPSYAYKIASAYSEGKDEFPQDTERATIWYERAASKSDLTSQAHLGWKFWTGSGVVQSNEKAILWVNNVVETAKKARGNSKETSAIEISATRLLNAIKSNQKPMPFQNYLIVEKFN